MKRRINILTKKGIYTLWRKEFYKKRLTLLGKYNNITVLSDNAVMLR